MFSLLKRDECKLNIADLLQGYRKLQANAVGDCKTRLQSLSMFLPAYATMRVFNGDIYSK